jgi:hypothetical protein
MVKNHLFEMIVNGNLLGLCETVRNDGLQRCFDEVVLRCSPAASCPKGSEMNLKSMRKGVRKEPGITSERGMDDVIEHR